MSLQISFQEIVEETLKKAARQAVESVIADQSGYGIETIIKTMIKERASTIIKEPEIEQKIRDALVYWIKKES